jgi:N-glycosylase/DNA lyase
MKSATDALRALYAAIKPAVDARLAEFRVLGSAGSDDALFREMCFCTCTPQTDAHRAFDAAEALERRGLLRAGSAADIAAALRECGVRFHNNKAAYIAENRRKFLPGIGAALAEIPAQAGVGARNGLAAQVRGWGLKEASHFLRNTGRGSRVCILDRHILRRLAFYGVIKAVPASLAPALYCAIESRMQGFAAQIQVPPDALDLVFWYQAKGEVFR